MKNLSTTGACLLLTLAVFATTEIQKTTVYFTSDSHILNEEALEILDNFLNDVQLTGDYEFQIDGHTDQEGNNSYNNVLSRQRAETVKSFLSKRGIETQILFTESHGKRQLLFKNQDAESMRKNRRVDIVFKRFYFEDVNEMLAELAQSTQNSFQIETDQANTLTCKHNSRIYIPKNSFVDSLGNPYRGVVNIEVIEALNYHDFLANNLQTISDTLVLESGGMLNIQAFTENGLPLELADGSSLSIALPAGRSPTVPGMSLFVSNSNGSNWINTTLPAISNRDLNIPDKPERTLPSVEFPKYVFDKSGKPHQPYMPLYPSLPIKPRPESYFREIKWYEFFSRKRIEASMQLRYDIAMFNYENKLERHKDRVKKYQQDSVKFPTWVKEYEAELAIWKLKKKNSFEDFTNNEWKEALHAYMYLSDIEKEKYASRYAVWDSIRLAKQREYESMLDRLGFPEGIDPNYYLFEETNLGWINCDRFLNLPPSEQFQMTAHIQESSPDERVMIILPKTKALVNMTRNPDHFYLSPTLPFSEEVLVLAYKIEEGGIKMASSRTFKQNSVQLEYESIKVSEFRKYLKEIGV